MKEWMNEWINEWINEWVNEWMNQWMNEFMTPFMFDMIIELSVNLLKWWQISPSSYYGLLISVFQSETGNSFCKRYLGHGAAIYKMFQCEKNNRQSFVTRKCNNGKIFARLSLLQDIVKNIWFDDIFR